MAKLGDMKIGSLIPLNVRGVETNFIIVHQGAPSTNFYSNCDGTWLLMEKIYEKRSWTTDKQVNRYSRSDVHTYLNNTFVNYFDTDVQSAIKNAVIPEATRGLSYITSGYITTMSAKVFLLSVGELDGYGAEGDKLSYFAGGGDSKRVAYYNSAADEWFTRTPREYVSDYEEYSAANVYHKGQIGSRLNSWNSGIRPALVLSSDFAVAGGAISGTVAIGGVQRTLTGEGYVNIGGTLRPLTGSQVNIGGVLKTIGG